MGMASRASLPSPSADAQAGPEPSRPSSLRGHSRNHYSPAEMREGRSAYGFIAPTTVLLAIFYLWPLLQTIGYSFTNWNPATGSTGGFAGGGNFVALLHDSEFLGAIRNTAIYVIVEVPVTLAIGMVLAALLAKPFHGRAVYRALLFVPYIAPVVGSSLIFTYLLSPLGGVVNGALQALGVPPVGFLTTEPWALISVIVFSIWQQTGYTMIIYSAALSGIPASYYEAASLDGAGTLRQFFRISVPLVKPTTGFLSVTGVIGALQVFTQVYVLTQGGPLHSSETILYYIYQQGFVFFHGGSASAAAVVLLLIGIITAVFQLRVLNRQDPLELV